MKNIFHTNGPEKKAGVAILTYKKIDFKTKLVKSDREGHCIFIRGKIHQNDILILNTRAPNLTHTHTKKKPSTAT